MMGKAHIAFGSGAWLAACSLIGHQPGALEMAAVVLGSLMPDADHPKSKIGRFLPGVSHFFYYVAGGHRGITHSALLCIPMLMVAYSFWGIHLGVSQGLFSWHSSASDPYSTFEGYAAVVILAFTFGYLSHLVGDVITKQGLRFFWPLPFLIRVTPFRADSPVINLLAYSVLCVGVVMQVALLL